MRRLLIIRPGAVGDALLTFPVLRALRERYAPEHITFVSNAAVLSLALSVGVADSVEDYGALQWSELFLETGIRCPALLQLLAECDLAICWLRDSDGLVERNLRQAGCRQVLISPSRPAAGEDIHIARYLAQTAGIIEVNLSQAFRPRSALDAWNEEARSDVGRIQTARAGQIVAIHPGSGGVHKCWPIERFAELISALWQRDITVLLLSGPADTGRVQELLNLLEPLPDEQRLLSVLNNLPLAELAAELLRVCCYVGNDSGITHLSALLGVPTIALFGPSDPRVWRPAGPQVIVLQESSLENVRVELVLSHIKMHL